MNSFFKRISKLAVVGVTLEASTRHDIVRLGQVLQDLDKAPKVRDYSSKPADTATVADNEKTVVRSSC